MWIQSLLLATTVACVNAGYTIPFPIHHEIEAQLQKQLNIRNLRWDATNYLTFLAAVFAQCSNLYDNDGTRLFQKGRVNNATAYKTLEKFFHPSLLQGNLVVTFFDIESSESQDAGTVDRDIRKLSGKANGAGPLGNLPNVDSTIRTYDRFACSVETKCKVGITPVMALVCVFGQSSPRQVSGTGEVPTPATTRAAATTRAVVTTTTRPRPPTVTTKRPIRTQPTTTQTTTTTATTTTTTTTTTTATASASPAVPIGGGLYQTYKEHSQEFYDSIMKLESIQSALPEIEPDEQKLVNLSLCNFEQYPDLFTSDLLRPSFDDYVQPILYATVLSPRPSNKDIASYPITDVAKGALRSALQQPIIQDSSFANSIACAWALCTEKFLLACAAWGSSDIDDYSEEMRASF